MTQYTYVNHIPWQSFFDEEEKINNEIKIMSHKAAQLSSPSTFAEAAKIEREIAKKRKLLKEIITKREQSRILYILFLLRLFVKVRFPWRISASNFGIQQQYTYYYLYTTILLMDLKEQTY